jgi:hypothetical protein
MRKQAPVLLALSAVLIAWLAASRLHAQEPSTSYELLMSPDEIRAFLTAREQHLGFIPGETLVKFRPGMAPTDQTRAISALRRGTTASAMTRRIRCSGTWI